jgi:hypothetical protein
MHPHKSQLTFDKRANAVCVSLTAVTQMPESTNSKEETFILAHGFSPSWQGGKRS